MESNCLTPELKRYYQEDFNKLLDFKEDSFWDLDDGLKDALIKINSSSNIATLYSAKYCPNQNSISLEPKSYLDFAFSFHIKEKIVIFFDEISEHFKLEQENFFYVLNYPEYNVNYKTELKSPLGCLNNPEYFRINYYKVYLKSPQLKQHDLFWSLISKELSNM